MTETLHHVPILNIDVQGFTTHNRDTQFTLIRRLQDILTAVAQPFLPAADPWALWRRHGTGDGYYIVFVGHAAPTALQYALQLAAKITTYNAEHKQDLPLRLYGALVLGDVQRIADQYLSEAFSEAARLLSHEPFKKSLQQRPMVLAMSALFHTEWRAAMAQHNPYPETATLLWTPFVCRDKHGQEHHGYVLGPGWDEPDAAVSTPIPASIPHPEPAPPQAESMAPVPFAGPIKLAVCQRLGDKWHDLADYLDIPVHDRARFPHGLEPQRVWEWLEVRDRLADLAPALVALDRQDLAKLLQRP